MKNTSFSFLLFLFYCTSGCFSCKPKTLEPSEIDWYVLKITSENNTRITVLPGDDTVLVMVYNTGSIFKRPKKITVDTLKFVFNKNERDSLFILADRIITSPPKVKTHCTDFVGDLEIIAYYDQTVKKSINYSGVCNWNFLSPQTIKLHNLLKRKLKHVFLGEDDNTRSHSEY